MSNVYTEEFKQGVLIVARSVSVASASTSFMVPQSTIRNWLKKYPVEVVEEPRDIKEERSLAVWYLDKSKNAKAPFDMTFSEFKTMAQATHCAYTGLVLTGDNTSIERMDPFVGYTPDNAVLVTKEANTAKAKLDSFLKEPTFTWETKIKLLNYAKDILVNRLEAQVEKKKELTANNPDINDPDVAADWSRFLARLRTVSGNQNADAADKRRILHYVSMKIAGKVDQASTSGWAAHIISVAESLVNGLDNLDKKGALTLLNKMSPRIAAGEFL